MDGLYTALSGLLAQGGSLAAIAGNLANAQSPGYLAQTGNVSDNVTAIYARSGGTQGGAWLGVELSGVVYTNAFDLQPGPIEPTGRATDIGLGGNGFFAVRTPAGQLAYTRNGAFTLDPLGRLVTASGAILLDTQGNPLTLTPGQPFTVQSDGTVVQGGAVVGQIGVFQLAPGTVASLGQALYQGQAAPANVQVVQGSLTQSNVSLVSSAERMLQAEIAYQALTAAVNAESNRSRTASGLGTLA